MLTYVVARRSLVDDRRAVIQKLIFADFLEVQTAFGNDKSDPTELLKLQKVAQDDVDILVKRGGAVYSSGLLSESQIPRSLREKTN